MNNEQKYVVFIELSEQCRRSCDLFFQKVHTYRKQTVNSIKTISKDFLATVTLGWFYSGIRMSIHRGFGFLESFKVIFLLCTYIISYLYEQV